MVEAQRATRAQTRLMVLTLPAEIDMCNAHRLGGELGRALASATIVIADMTATTFCDSSGIRILVLANEQASATGIELRLVVPSGHVLRTLELIGADRLLPIYPSLADALGSEPTSFYRTDGPCG
jgi:anti-sigma B factor antagonist